MPGEEVRRWKAAFEAVKAMAKWIGIATHAAGNHPQFPFRDSEASRWKAVAAQRNRVAKKVGVDGRRRRAAKPTNRIIPASRGGHTIGLALSGHCWLCTKCKARSSSRAKLAASKCGGSGVKPRDTIEATMTAGPVGKGRKHVLVVAGRCNGVTRVAPTRRVEPRIAWLVPAPGLHPCLLAEVA